MTSPKDACARIRDLGRKGYGVDDIRVMSGESYDYIARCLETAEAALWPLANLAKRRATGSMRASPYRPARPCPKPEKPVRRTAATKAHMSLVAQLRCICCLAPSEVLHHAIHGRFAQRKASDMDVIPMCVRHHQLLHSHPDAWRAAYGADADYLPKVQAAVEWLRANTIGGR